MEQNPIQKQNLIKPISSVVIRRPPGFYKAIILDALVVLSGVLYGYVLSRYANEHIPFSFVVGGFTIFAGMSFFGTILGKAFTRRVFVAALSAAGFLLFFWGNSWKEIALALAVSIFFIVWGELLTRRDLNYNLTFRFIKISRLHIAKFMSGIIAGSLIILFGSHLIPEDGKALSPQIPQKAFDSWYEQTTRLTNNFFPDIVFGSTVEDYAESVVKFQEKKSNLYAGIPPELYKDTFQMNVNAVIENLGSPVRGAVHAQQSAKDAFFSIANELMTDWHNRFGFSFTIAWVVALFLVIRGTGTLYYWLIAAILFFVYELLVAFNVIRKIRESVSREVVDYT